MTATIDDLQCEFSQATFDRAREQAAQAAQFAAMRRCRRGRIAARDLERHCCGQSRWR